MLQVNSPSYVPNNLLGYNLVAWSFVICCLELTAERWSFGCNIWTNGPTYVWSNIIYSLMSKGYFWFVFLYYRREHANHSPIYAFE